MSKEVMQQALAALGFAIKTATRPERSEGMYVPAARALIAAMSLPDARPVAWAAMKTAPKDGRIVRLLVEFADYALDDDGSPQATIGFNTFDDHGVDIWNFAGWDWQQDCFTQGVGEPIGWLPIPEAPPPPETVVPIDMVLHCPRCGAQHVDAQECHAEKPHLTAWSNPPHRSHLCYACQHIWRPADVPTNGVMAVKTAGKADSPLAASLPVIAPESAMLEDHEIDNWVVTIAEYDLAGWRLWGDKPIRKFARAIEAAVHAKQRKKL